MTRSPRDCIYGRAVEYALGVLYKFRPRGTFRCTGMVVHGCHNKQAGAWSDDTSMAHAIYDSYHELGHIDVDDIRGSFVRGAFDAVLKCLTNMSSCAEYALAPENLGDDTDTTTAVACALAGIICGIKGIPAERHDKPWGKDVIVVCLL